jgi:anti-anti-sigma factor
MATIRLIKDAGVPVLLVEGKLGLESLTRFEAGLQELIREPGKCLILDLMDCPYMSSRTFPPLLHAREELEASRRHLLIACSQGLLEILQILRLDQKLRLHATRVECLDIARTLSSL